jgi:UDP-glucose 4-epimerase
MKNILVTGGLGFIGSSLVERLRKDNKVTVVDNISSAREDWRELIDKNSDVEYIEACYSSPMILNSLRAGKFDYVFHVAAVPRVLYSVENPVETTDNNVMKTISLIDGSIKGGVKRFIFSSSSSVYGGAEVLPTPVDFKKDPKSPYAWHKSSVEDYIAMASFLYNVDMVSLRYFNVFGPGQFGGSAYSTAVSAWCHAIKNEKPLRKDGTGEQSRDMCYIDNVVDANIRAMESKNKFSGDCFNVACGDRVSNNEILEFLSKRYSDIKIKEAPFRMGDVMHTLADISESEKTLGYSPKIRFWEGLEKTLEWWGLD